MVMKSKMCVKCKCNPAHYSITYNDVLKGGTVKLNLCHGCQMMMVNVIERCQGLEEGRR